MCLHLKLLDVDHPLTFEVRKLRKIEAHALIYLSSCTFPSRTPRAKCMVAWNLVRCDFFVSTILRNNTQLGHISTYTFAWLLLKNFKAIALIYHLSKRLTIFVKFCLKVCNVVFTLAFTVSNDLTASSSMTESNVDTRTRFSCL